MGPARSIGIKVRRHVSERAAAPVIAGRPSNQARLAHHLAQAIGDFSAHTAIEQRNRACRALREAGE